MSFFAVLLALLIEQARPLPRGRALQQGMSRWAEWIRRHFDAGRARHAWVVWGMTVVAPAVVTGVVYLAIQEVSVLLALALDVAVLYLTLGFRQFSHYFTDIRDALERGDDAMARELLQEWRGVDTQDWPRPELLRHSVEQSLLAAHRHVFGVFFWFVLLSALGLGPAGAVLYRWAERVQSHWGFARGGQVDWMGSALGDVSQRLFRLLDAAPARLTASGFAIVGNFEEAVNAWRRDAGLWSDPNEGVILATAAGAIAVELAVPPVMSSPPSDEVAELAAGEGHEGIPSGRLAPLQLAHLQQLIGLVWRSVVFWMLLLALLTLSNIVG
jgi:adenosylcobinamide-phosphate synthase